MNRSKRDRISYSPDYDLNTCSPSRFTANSRAKWLWADMFSADEHLYSRGFAYVKSSEEVWMNEVREQAALSRDQKEREYREQAALWRDQKERGYIGWMNEVREQVALLRDQKEREYIGWMKVREQAALLRDRKEYSGWMNEAREQAALLRDRKEYSGWMNEAREQAALSRDQKEEYIGFCNVRRKKDFVLMERVKGEFLNVVDGLELHTCVFSVEEQRRIVSYVQCLEDMGSKGLLKERTYSAPRKWMRGKGRVTLQFGCCYNYAMDKSGNPPGILRDEIVDPIPELFKSMIKRLVRWSVLPVSCVPDSCIVNIYEEEDCIPPHIDNHDFLRPFCTVSFLSECEILFGSNLKIVGAGEFSGSLAVPLPVGSVLVINGNGADVAKHCVPAVPARRISITFRKMCQSKLPVGYVPEPDLIGLQPLSYDSVGPPRARPSITHYATECRSSSRKRMVERDGIDNRRRLVHEDRFQSSDEILDQGRRH